jgi:hypothetical protein
MQIEVRLVHAETGRRVVEARAVRAGQLVSNALGEAADAETAEDRAVARLRQRLDLEASALAAAGGSPVLAGAVEGERERAAPPRRADPGMARGAAGAPAPGSDRAAASDQGAAGGGDAGAVAATAPRAAPGLADTPGGGASAPPPQEPEPNAGNDAVHSADGGDAEASDGVEWPQGDRSEDPDDWSSELARLDLSLRRIGWSREQEADYLRRAFGHPSRSRITSYSDLQAYLRMLDNLEQGADPRLAAVPLRRRDLMAQSETLLHQLGWNEERARRFSAEHLGGRSRQQLNDEQLLQCNMLLEAELIAASAAVLQQQSRPPGEPDSRAPAAPPTPSASDRPGDQAAADTRPSPGHPARAASGAD